MDQTITLRRLLPSHRRCMMLSFIYVAVCHLPLGGRLLYAQIPSHAVGERLGAPAKNDIICANLISVFVEATIGRPQKTISFARTKPLCHPERSPPEIPPTLKATALLRSSISLPLHSE